VEKKALLKKSAKKGGKDLAKVVIGKNQEIKSIQEGLKTF
jgi:hypothetical protein